MSTTDDTPDDDSTDRFDQPIYNLEILDRGEDAEAWDQVPCTPTEHDGQPVILYAMGSHDEDVRKVKSCTACGLAIEETAYDDVHGISLEGRDGLRDRVHNFPGDETAIKVPMEDFIDDWLTQKGFEPYDVTHVGLVEDGDLLFKITEPEEMED